MKGHVNETQAKMTSEIPEGLEGNQVLQALEELQKVGGSMFRSKHFKARQIRKKARLLKRLQKGGVVKIRGRKKKFNV